MDVFLFLYVVGLMVLFFLLGAAIGGAARSFKAYFFGFGENEVYCGTSREAMDRDAADKSAIGAAALGGGAVAAGLQGDGAPNVVVTNDGEGVDPGQEWAAQDEAAAAVDLEADVNRAGDDAPVDEVSGIEAARPLGADEMPAGDDDYAGAEIFRGVDEPGMADQPAEDVAEFEEAAPHDAMQADEPLATENENPVSAEELVDEVPPGVTVSSDVTSSFDAAQHEPGFNELGEGGEAAAANEVGAGEGDEAEDGSALGDAGIAAGVAAVAGVVAGAVTDAVKEEEPETSDEPETLGEGRMPRPEAAKPVIWGYTSEDNNFSDVEFVATGDDQLTLIRGIDEDMEAALKALGVRQFEQISGFTARQVDFLKSRLGLTTEINTAGWIEQAKILSGGAMTVFAAGMAGENDAEADDSLTDDAVGDGDADVAVAGETEVMAPTEEALAPQEEAELVPAPAPVPADEPEEMLEAQADVVPEADEIAPEPASETVLESEPETETEQGDAGGVAETASLAALAAAEVATRSDDDGERKPSSDDGRLFSREERERRDEEWRQRYGGDRVIVPPSKRVSVDDAEPPVTDELEEAAASDVAGVAGIEQGGTFAGLADGEPDEDSGAVEVDDDGGAPVDSDDLKQIKFISTGLEKKLNLLGVYKLSQIAAWSSADIDEISEQLELKDRIREEGWVVQAGEAMDKGDAESGGFFGSQLVARLEELDQIEDLTEHEKTMLSSKGITSLSQIANWSGADKKWAMDLLEVGDQTRVDGWVSLAHSLLASGEGAVPGGTAFGEDDDLKRIRGIDVETEAALKEVGVTSYNQIASWEQSDMNRINDMLGTAGRVERQYWVVQAKVLRDGGTTDYSKLYDGSNDQG